MSEQSTDLKPSLFDGDDAAAGRVDRAAWRIMGGRLEPEEPVMSEIERVWLLRWTAQTNSGLTNHTNGRSER